MKHILLVEVTVYDSQLYDGCLVAGAIRNITLQNGMRFPGYADYKIISVDGVKQEGLNG